LVASEKVKAEALTVVAAREEAIAKEQAQKVAASATVLSKLNGNVVEAAVSSQSAALLPRVYMQIVNQNDRDIANQIKDRLTSIGVLVLGIQYAPKAAGLKTSDVRYYRKVDEAEAQKILGVLKDAGEESPRLQYLPGFEDSTTVRPNHFEVWLASQTSISSPVVSAN
jgi:hypothetical protein